MGFDVNRFKSPALLEEIPRIFCMFCEKVLQEPMSLSTCGHVFCKNCVRGSILKEKLCPEDRQPFELQDIEEGPQAVVQLLDSLEIACNFAAFGCNEFVKLKQLANHCKDCPCRPEALFECPDKCGATFKRNQKESHSCASYLLGIIEGNKKLVNIINKQRSQQVIKVVKEIIAIENQVHGRLQELVGNLTLKEEKSNQNQKGIKRPLNDLKDGSQKKMISHENGFSRAHGVHEELERRHSSGGKSGPNGGSLLASTTKSLKMDATSSPVTSSNGSKTIAKTFKQEAEDEASSHFSFETDVEASHAYFTRSAEKGKRRLYYEDPIDFKVEEEDFTPQTELIDTLKFKHEGEHFSEKKLELPCNLCQKKFTKHSNLLAHQPCYFMERGIKGKKKVAFDCDVCGKNFKELRYLRQHIAAHVDTDMFGCNHCGKRFPSRRQVVEHIRSHTGSRSFQCKYCEKCFVMSSSLEEHLLLHEGDGSHTNGNRTNYASNSEADLEGDEDEDDEMGYEDEEGEGGRQGVEKREREQYGFEDGDSSGSEFSLFEDETGEGFEGRKTLEPQTGSNELKSVQPLNGEGVSRWITKIFKSKGRDVEVLVKDVAFRCNLCNNDFPRKSNLMAHKPCHSVKRSSKDASTSLPYECQFCASRFSELIHMRSHLALHLDADMYQCVECRKGFCREQDVVSHNRMHSGDRPFVCKHCNKMFSQRHHLKDHLLLHTGEKPYVCNWPECGQKFSKKASLMLHNKKHDDERPFKCFAPGCSFRFTSSSNRGAHFKKVHPLVSMTD